jgi:hypothetical protein
MDKNNQYLEKSVMAGWQFLVGDINYMDYGGKWVKQIDDTIYHVIELINWHDATGEYLKPTYNVELQEIDISKADLKSALDCHGYTQDNISSWDNLEIMLVECVSGYGQYAPMGTYNGNNYRKLLTQAKQESKQIESDYDYHCYKLDRPVNKLGSTAQEYMVGDFNSALIRGIASNDPHAKIFGKIHGLTEEDMSSVDESLSDFTLNPACDKL